MPPTETRTVYIVIRQAWVRQQLRIQTRAQLMPYRGKRAMEHDSKTIVITGASGNLGNKPRCHLLPLTMPSVPLSVCPLGSSGNSFPLKEAVHFLLLSPI